MKDLLDKISSYNIFNYLLPGTIFVVLAEVFTEHSFLQKDIILSVFLYYFIGLVISRTGSLIFEPLLKLIRFLRFSDYKDFVTASRTDAKLDVLSEANNMYRTFCSLLLLLLILKVYEKAVSTFPEIGNWGGCLLLFGLFLLFLFSYRKQTKHSHPMA
jgi:hypothetical protein